MSPEQLVTPNSLITNCVQGIAQRSTYTANELLQFEYLTILNIAKQNETF